MTSRRLRLCSEGSGADGTVAYYQSRFEVPVSQQASLDQAVQSLQQQQQPLGGPDGRQQRRPAGGLSVSGVVAQGLTPAVGGLPLGRPRCDLPASCRHFLLENFSFC